MSAKELARTIHKKLGFSKISLEQVEAVLFVIKDEHLDETHEVLQKERYNELKQLETRLRNSGM